jgi:hypothetical protein
VFSQVIEARLTVAFNPEISGFLFFLEAMYAKEHSLHSELNPLDLWIFL